MKNIFSSKKDHARTDEELLEQTKNWKSEMFEILYDRWNKKIYNYMLQLLNYNQEDANTILSDLFIKIYEYNKYKDIQNFKGFLYFIARNMCIDYIKTNKSENKYAFNQDTVIDYIDEEDFKEKESINQLFESDLLKSALYEMEDKYREILYLYYFEQKSYQEIAKIVDSNKNSVWTLLSQWKKKLKNIILQKWRNEILSQ